MVGLRARGTRIGHKIASAVLIKLDNTETGICINNTTKTGPTVLHSVRADYWQSMGVTWNTRKASKMERILD